MSDDDAAALQTALTGGDAEQQVAAALRDPDQRLGVILPATVEAFEANPAEPLQIWPMASVDPGPAFSLAAAA